MMYYILKKTEKMKKQKTHKGEGGGEREGEGFL